MDKELRDKWCEALRSGNFLQGSDYLYNKEDKTYCCLGVLNKIMKGKAKDSHKDNDSDRPLKIKIIPPEIQLKLVDMNDGNHRKKPASFKEIANWIEKNL